MWPSLRAPLLAVVLTTAIALPALAHASPPDSTWIAGVYDDADSDDVIVRVTSAAGDAASGPPADLRPLHALVLSLGGLWNTFSFIAGVAALIEAGRACVPLLHDRLVRLAVFAGTQFEAWAVRQAYLFAPAADFSRSVLASTLPRLAVARLPPCTWCDIGVPERVARARAGQE